MQKRYKITFAILATVLAIIGAFVFWATTPLGPGQESIFALQSDASVEVRTDNWLVFSPVNSEKTIAFIIYPGGRVDPRSYASVARSIAERGYLTIIVPMPLNLAVFGVNKAARVIESFPEIQVWAIGGHSLGGTMAAQFVYDNPSKVEGLVLWASYPASGTDLSNSTLPTTTIFGTNDGIVGESKIEESIRLLPKNTISVAVQGGNHAQFGSYGEQSGDNAATISQELQELLVVDATVSLLDSLQ